MTNPADSFWSGGGGKSLSWKNVPVGTSYAGTITVVHPPQQITDPVDNKPVFKKDGVTPKLQARLDLATSYRDPSDPDDDGARSLYVGGWMTGAIGDAIRKATGKVGPPEVGAVLRVTLIAREENENRALNPTNKFSAEYVPPTAAATGDFYGGGQPAAAPSPQPQYPLPGVPAQPQPQYAPPPPPQPPQPQPQPQPQYAPPPPMQYAPAPVAQPVPQQQAGPVKPPGFSDAAWASMDEPTRATVAATMGGAAAAPPPY